MAQGPYHNYRRALFGPHSVLKMLKMVANIWKWGNFPQKSEFLVSLEKLEKSKNRRPPSNGKVWLKYHTPLYKRQVLSSSHTLQLLMSTGILVCNSCLDPSTLLTWRRKWQPTPVFLPGESMDRGAWRPTVHGVTRVGHDLATKPPPPPRCLTEGRPWWLRDEELACECRSHGFDPWSRKIPHAWSN